MKVGRTHRTHDTHMRARYLEQAAGVLLLSGGAGDKGAVELLLEEEERVAPLHHHVHARHEPTFGPHRPKADRKNGPGRGVAHTTHDTRHTTHDTRHTHAHTHTHTQHTTHAQIKSRVQTDHPDPSQRRYRGVLDCVRQIHATEGYRGFWRGFSAVRPYPLLSFHACNQLLTPPLRTCACLCFQCLVRAFPVNAATFLAFETFRSLISV